MADYYTAASDPADDSDLDSSIIRAEWTALAAGFAKIAGYTGNGSKVIAINSGGTAMEALTTTGTGNGVRATSPTLVTPVLGVATATSINKITFTQPATGATLTLVDGSTLVTAGAYSTTLTATGATNVTLPTTGTLATLAGAEELDNKTLDASVGKGTWTASGTWTLPAVTLGGAVTVPTGVTVTGAGTAAITGFTSVSATTGTFTNIGGFALTGGITSATNQAINIGSGALTAGAISGTSFVAGGTSLTAFAAATTLLTLGGTGATSVVAIPGTKESTAFNAGAVTIAGGLGVAKALWAGGAIKSTTPAGFQVAPLTGTDSGYYGVSTTGGALYIGLDSSAAAVFGTAGNYGTVIYRPASTGFAISRASTVDLSISATGAVTIPGTLALTATATPTGTGAGVVGQIAWDTSYLYICTATNDWRRVAITDF